MKTKPRIIRRYGVWTCRCRWDVLIVGHGYTPRAAYEDWNAQWQFRETLPHWH